MVIGQLKCDSSMAVISHPNLFCSGEKGVFGAEGSVWVEVFLRGCRIYPHTKTPNKNSYHPQFLLHRVSYKFMIDTKRCKSQTKNNNEREGWIKGPSLVVN